MRSVRRAASSAQTAPRECPEDADRLARGRHDGDDVLVLALDRVAVGVAHGVAGLRVLDDAEPVPCGLTVLERRLHAAARERGSAGHDRRPVGDLDVARQERALIGLVDVDVGLGGVEPAARRVDPAAQPEEGGRVEALPAAARQAQPAFGIGVRRAEVTREVVGDAEPEHGLQPPGERIVSERVDGATPVIRRTAGSATARSASRSSPSCARTRASRRSTCTSRASTPSENGRSRSSSDARPASTTCPRAPARCASSCMSRDLPIPGSPVIPTARERPARASSSARSSASSSASRPTSDTPSPLMTRRP